MLPYLKITHTNVHTCIHTAYMQSPDKVVQAAWTYAGTAPQWCSEGRAWPGTSPAKVCPAHVLVLLAQWLSIQQVPGQYQ